MSRVCKQTPQVLASIERGDPSPELKQHLDRCADCTDAVAVERFLHASCSRVPSLDRLPDPTTLWWRSRHLARQVEVSRATRPIQILERVAFAFGAAGLAFGVTRAWPAVRSSASTWLASLFEGARGATDASLGSDVILVGTAILAVFAAGLYSQWVEE